jgi:hypothetical protein
MLNDKNKRGVSQAETVSPKTLSHFHINTVDDQVVFNAYPRNNELVFDKSTRSKTQMRSRPSTLNRIKLDFSGSTQIIDESFLLSLRPVDVKVSNDSLDGLYK